MTVTGQLNNLFTEYVLRTFSMKDNKVISCAVIFFKALHHLVKVGSGTVFEICL